MRDLSGIEASVGVSVTLWAMRVSSATTLVERRTSLHRQLFFWSGHRRSRVRERGGRIWHRFYTARPGMTYWNREKVMRIRWWTNPPNTSQDSPNLSLWA